MARQCRGCAYYSYNGIAGYCSKSYGRKVKIRTWGWAPAWCPLEKIAKIRKEAVGVEEQEKTDEYWRRRQAEATEGEQ